MFDVAVIGAGLVGAAIARELAGTSLSVALVEARNDVGDGTSKANTAILHTGFDAKPGTLESRLVRRGYELLSRLRGPDRDPGRAHRRAPGGLDAEELEALPGLQAKAVANGYEACELVDPSRSTAELPALAPGALGGLTVPDESITCTWTTNLALATDAVSRGCVLQAAAIASSRSSRSRRSHDAADIERSGVGSVGGQCCRARRRMWSMRCSDTIGSRSRRDVASSSSSTSSLGRWHRRSCCRFRRRLGKGVLVSPTIYGNVMLGPTAEDLRRSHGDGYVGVWLRFPCAEGRTADAAAAARGGHGVVRGIARRYRP